MGIRSICKVASLGLLPIDLVLIGLRERYLKQKSIIE